MIPTLPPIADQLRHIAEKLSADATWEDVIEEILTRRGIARGLEDVAAGRTIPHEEVREYLAKRQRERAIKVE